MADSRWIPTDLAPGDQRALQLDVSGLVLRSIASTADPAFRPAYEFLAQTFGHTGALETVEVLAQRLAWPRQPQADGWTLRYELLSISSPDADVVAVRDHTAVVPPGEAAGAIVHLSHALIAQSWRRSGLGGWLRALPVQIARECLPSSGAAARDDAAITLVAEMEHASPDHAAASLLAYEKAGFRKLDPARVPYAQPDFRLPSEIDRTGGPRPLPFSLVLRQVGREEQTEVGAATARALARGLYRIYRDGCRARDLAPLLARIESDYPLQGQHVRLLPPSAV